MEHSLDVSSARVENPLGISKILMPTDFSNNARESNRAINGTVQSRRPPGDAEAFHRHAPTAADGRSNSPNGTPHGMSPTAHSRSLRGLSDEDLMEHLQEGDDAALNILYRRYARRVQWYLLKLVGNRQTAEDLTQETFYRVYRSRFSYRRIAKFGTWLYTIAGNLARSEYRSRKRAQKLYIQSEMEPVGQQVPDETFRPDVSVETILMHERVLRALEFVPESFREVVVLRGIQDLSYKEIRDITGTRMGTVKSRIHRGRAMLSNLLNEKAVV